MNIEKNVASYYTRGRLEDSILQALSRAGKDLANLTHGDLAALDEFHVGGREATQELAAQMELRPGIHLLDVGKRDRRASSLLCRGARMQSYRSRLNRRICICFQEFDAPNQA